jgi:hypothetical protein
LAVYTNCVAFNYNCGSSGKPKAAPSGITITVSCQGQDVADMTCAPAPWSEKYLADNWEPYRVGWDAVAAMFGQTYRMAAGPVYAAAAGTAIVSGAAVAPAVGALGASANTAAYSVSAAAETYGIPITATSIWTIEHWDDIENWRDIIFDWGIPCAEGEGC